MRRRYFCSNQPPCEGRFCGSAHTSGKPLGIRNASGTMVYGRGLSSAGDGFAAYSVRDRPVVSGPLVSTTVEAAEPCVIPSSLTLCNGFEGGKVRHLCLCAVKKFL